MAAAKSASPAEAKQAAQVTTAEQKEQQQPQDDDAASTKDSSADAKADTTETPTNGQVKRSPAQADAPEEGAVEASNGATLTADEDAAANGDEPFHEEDDGTGEDGGDGSSERARSTSVVSTKSNPRSKGKKRKGARSSTAAAAAARRKKAAATAQNVERADEDAAVDSTDAADATDAVVENGAAGTEEQATAGEPSDGAAEAAPAEEATSGESKKGTPSDSGSKSPAPASGSGSATTPAGSSDKHRQRSTSTFKELASLGLRAVGDGEEEPLLPRRTRGRATSPSLGGAKMEEADDDGKPLVDENGEASADAKMEEADEERPTDGKPAGPAPAEAIPAADASAEVPPAGEEEGDWEEGGVTRCVCGSSDENVGLMIQCEDCKCWQHCVCMGLHTEEDCPDVYYCEQCKPELHIPLLRTLGVLAPAHGASAGKGGKKGSHAKNSKANANVSKKELRDAAEQVLGLAKENERKRLQGLEPVTGWSVAQQLASARREEDDDGHAGGRRSRALRSESRDEENLANTSGGGRNRSPKRRSTMNSRDSNYGWEAIPPGLLNDDENWDIRGDGLGRRKRARDDQGQTRSPSIPHDDATKRRRMSNNHDDGAAGPRTRAHDTDSSASSAAGKRGAQANNGAAGTKRGRGVDADDGNTAEAQAPPPPKPKHPNQYTYRKQNLAAQAAAQAAGHTTASNGGQGNSGSPSPSKGRNTDNRRAAALREAAAASRNGTPMPVEDLPAHSTGGGGGRGAKHPGASFGLPDHLSHLSFLLPGAQPEPVAFTVPSTSGARNSNARGASSRNAATSDAAAGASAATASGSSIHITPIAYDSLSLSEPPTKIRFPARRMTLGEMRKRVRIIGEYVTRSHIEVIERERRLRLLGIVTDEDENEQAKSGARSEEAEKDKDRAEAEKDADGDAKMEDAQQAPAKVGGEAKDGTAEVARDKTGAMPGTAQETEQPQAAPGVTEKPPTAEEQAGPATQALQEQQEAAQAAKGSGTNSGSSSNEGTKAPTTPAPTGASANATASTYSNGVPPPQAADGAALSAMRSMALVEELSREVLSFQNRFGGVTLHGVLV